MVMRRARRLDAGARRDEVLADLVNLIAETPLVVEVRFGSADAPPERHVFHRSDALVRFVSMLVGPGDVVRAWRFDEACPPDAAVVAATIEAAAARADR